MFEQLMGDFQAIVTGFKESIIAFLPNLLGALFILVLGLVVARLLRFLTNRFLKNLGRLIPHRKVRSRLEPANLERSASVVSLLLYWIVLFFFITAATETLGLPVVTTWLSGVALYLPRVLLAALIVAAGLIGGMMLRELITTGAASAHLAYAGFLGKVTQYALVVISILVAIDEIGIDVTVLTSILAIVVAALLLGAALAFAFGAKATISNIIAAYYVQKQYTVGQTIQIESARGEIMEITPTAVILKTAEGTVYVPARHFTEHISRQIVNSECKTVSHEP